MKKATMADVAQLANVSKSTVSQFLNKRYDYMGEKTKQRIEEAIKELGYQANYIARSLKQKKTSTIGVIVANILHAFSTQVIRAIEDVCNEHDVHVIVCNSDDDPKKEKKYIDMLRAKQIDGLIILPTGENTDLYKTLVNENYPLVFVDRTMDGLEVNTVTLDNEKAAKYAVDHLFERGHRKIAMLTAPMKISTRMERISGYYDALKNNNIQPVENYAKGVEMTGIGKVLSEMLKLPEPPTALIAGSDRVFFQVFRFIKENHIQVPDDLALIAFDDIELADFIAPSITTVAQPTFEMGKKAANLLLNDINNEQADNQCRDYRFEPKLVIRNSV